MKRAGLATGEMTFIVKEKFDDVRDLLIEINVEVTSSIDDDQIVVENHYIDDIGMYHDEMCDFTRLEDLKENIDKYFIYKVTPGQDGVKVEYEFQNKEEFLTKAKEEFEKIVEEIKASFEE